MLAFGSPSRSEAARLGATGASAALAQAVFLAGGHRRLLGVLSVSLELLVELALVLFALSLTGGLASPLYALVLLDVVLASRFLGREPARYLAIAAAAGLAYLASVSMPPPFSLNAAFLLQVAERALPPVALLAAIELGGRATPAAEDALGRRSAAPPAPRPGVREEILHDLRSPLTVLRVYADLIAEQAVRGEPLSSEHLDNLRRELALMEGIVGVDASRPAAAAERTDLVAVLGRLVDVYRTAHRDRKIELVPARSEIPVLAEPVSLQRAFRNILDNAIKHSPAAAQIQVRAGVVPGNAFVVFSDTGAGMTEDERKRAFEFSYRGAEARASARAGKGLGLGLTRELLEANGGTVSLFSEPGRGLEVTVTLPLLDAEAA